MMWKWFREGTISILPFWRAEEQNRDFLLDKIGRFLEEAEQDLETESLVSRLTGEYNWSAEAAGRLLAFLKLQKEVTGSPLPHRHHLLIEHCDDPGNKTDSKQVILHTLWGGKVNRPFSLALAAAWEEKYAYPLEIYANNNSILLMLPHGFALWICLPWYRRTIWRPNYGANWKAAVFLGLNSARTPGAPCCCPRQILKSACLSGSTASGLKN